MVTIKYGKLLHKAFEQLGGDDATQAYVWWKLAAEQKQPAAITGIELGSDGRAHSSKPRNITS